MREGLIDIVQTAPYAPLHVRAASPAPTLRVVSDNSAEPQVTGPDAPAPPALEEPS
jgi:hypothetical protein